MLLFQNAEFNGDVHFFSLLLEIFLWGEFCLKNQNCQLKHKFGT